MNKMMLSYLWLFCISFVSLVSSFVPRVYYKENFHCNYKSLKSFATLVSPDSQEVQVDIVKNDLGLIAATSNDIDIVTAVNTVLSAIDAHKIEPHSILFFKSSTYESSPTFQYESILEILRDRFPSLHTVLGSTTGCPVGPNVPFEAPQEWDSRAGITMLFLDHAFVGKDSLQAFAMNVQEVEEIIAKPVSWNDQQSDDMEDGVSFVIATENIKTKMVKLCKALSIEHKMPTYGVTASTVTMLQSPKLYFWNEAQSINNNNNNHNNNDETNSNHTFQQIVAGVVGFRYKSRGLQVDHLLARSAHAVGPVYRVVQHDDANRILSIQVSSSLLCIIINIILLTM
jgi:hypothetical protein